MVLLQENKTWFWISHIVWNPRRCWEVWGQQEKWWRKRTEEEKCWKEIQQSPERKHFYPHHEKKSTRIYFLFILNNIYLEISNAIIIVYNVFDHINPPAPTSAPFHLSLYIMSSCLLIFITTWNWPEKGIRFPGPGVIGRDFIWSLGIKLKSSAKAVGDFNCRTLSPGPTGMRFLLLQVFRTLESWFQQAIERDSLCSSSFFLIRKGYFSTTMVTP